MDKELIDLERQIMDSVWVKGGDDLIEYFQSMTEEEAESLISKPFPQFEDSFILWRLEKHVRDYMNNRK